MSLAFPTSLSAHGLDYGWWCLGHNENCIFLTPEYIQGVKLTVRLKDDVSGRKGPAISFEIGRIAECSPKNILINKAVLLTVNPVIQSQLHPTYK